MLRRAVEIVEMRQRSCAKSCTLFRELERQRNEEAKALRRRKLLSELERAQWRSVSHPSGPDADRRPATRLGPSYRSDCGSRDQRSPCVVPYALVPRVCSSSREWMERQGPKSRMPLAIQQRPLVRFSMVGSLDCLGERDATQRLPIES
jgi:hypothetical protein